MTAARAPAKEPAARKPAPPRAPRTTGRAPSPATSPPRIVTPGPGVAKPPHAGQPTVIWQQLPSRWAPVDEPWLDRLTRTDLRLAGTLALAGLVAVFVTQMPRPMQIVFGAPLFEEFFKVGLALLPWAALRVQSLWLRLPTAGLVGAGFGVLEHYLSYSAETTTIYAGRVLFHCFTAGLSMAVLHGLRGADRRLLLACTLPSTFVHAANNSAAVSFALASFLFLEDRSDADLEGLALSIAAGFLVLLMAVCLTWPLWMEPYRRFSERWMLPRLRPPGSAISATTAAPVEASSSTSGRS